MAKYLLLFAKLPFQIKYVDILLLKIFKKYFKILPADNIHERNTKGAHLQ